VATIVASAPRDVELWCDHFELRSGNRVVHDDVSVELGELTREVERRRVAKVIGVRLERRAEDRDSTLGDCSEALNEQVHDARALGAIDRCDSREEAGRVGEAARELLDGGKVLRKARTAEAKAGSQMTGADARVEREGLGEPVAVRSDRFTDAGQHVRERDLRCEEGVRRELAELRRDRIGVDDGSAKRCIECCHRLAGDAVA
jgi:hypothetical protein